MKNIRIFLSSFYNSNKRDFWILISANIGLGVLLNSFSFHPFIQAAVVAVMIFKNFTFIRSANVLPSIASDFDRFSWKYFQGLPLNKEELIVSLIISDLFVMFPLVVWLMSFFNQIAGLFVDHPEQISFSIPLKIFLCLIPIILFLSISSISNIITLPRKQYSKNDPRIVFFHKLKTFVVGVAVLLYAVFAHEFIQLLTGFSVGPYVVKTVTFISSLSTWWILPVLVLITAYNFSNLVKVWQNEKASYVKIKWNHKKDFSIIAVSLLLISAPLYNMDLTIPAKYNDGDIVKAVYRSNFDEVERLVKFGSDINEVNRHGFSPLHVAAISGQFHMYLYLELRGAKADTVIGSKLKKYEGNTILMSAILGGNYDLVKYLLDKGLSPDAKNEKWKFYPLHLASVKCKTKILDLLLEKKADVSVLNRFGRSALHNAASVGCFGSAISLLEAGSNPALKDKSGKMAINYSEKNFKTSELHYYLEKRTRSPASK